MQGDKMISMETKNIKGKETYTKKGQDGKAKKNQNGMYIMKKYSGYDYQIHLHKEGYSYEIWADSYMNGFSVVRESSEWYESGDEANEAAHAHIDKLESGYD